MKGKFTINYLIFREIRKIACVDPIFPVLYLNSLCFPCLEKLITKFPVFPVPWPPWYHLKEFCRYYYDKFQGQHAFKECLRASKVRYYAPNTSSCGIHFSNGKVLRSTHILRLTLRLWFFYLMFAVTQCAPNSIMGHNGTHLFAMSQSQTQSFNVNQALKWTLFISRTHSWHGKGPIGPTLENSRLTRTIANMLSHAPLLPWALKW